ncbi:MAG: hypothetical protein ABI639_07865 [Thermoanaerobaculia bacterium]
MTAPDRFAIWAGFAGAGGLATVALAVLGQMGAARMGVPGAAASVWLGCLASFAGSLAGALPLTQMIAERKAATATAASASRQPTPALAPISAIGKASLWRMLGALAAGGAAVASGRWDRKVLLFALAASYVVLLAVETGWMLRSLRATQA